MDDLCDGDVILVGSSMGGWSSLLAALERPARVKGLLLIAPAPDFTEKLMWAGFTGEQRRTIEDEGLLLVPSDYDEPYEYSRALIYDGRENLLLDSPIEFAGPVRILQGMQDASVPWQYAQKLLGVITSDDVEMTLVKSGDHSLSTPHDLERLTRTLEELCTRV
jgi:pimeloyl-ACP methyl ester carboxylesterase